MERFKDKYAIFINDKGYMEIINRRMNKLIEPRIQKDGVLHAVQIADQRGLYRLRGYSELTAQLFISNPNSEPMVCYKDFDHTNYKLDNLFWSNKQEETARLNSPEMIKEDIKKTRKQFSIPKDTKVDYYPASPRYLCDSDGNIYSRYRFMLGKYLNKSTTKLDMGPDKSGYLQVAIDARPKMARRVIAITLMPNPDNKAQVVHKKDVRDDNRISQLEWATQKESTARAIKAGLINIKGENSGTTKLLNSQAIEACRLFTKGTKTKDVAKKLGVKTGVIDHMRTRRNWRIITESEEFKDANFYPE